MPKEFEVRWTEFTYHLFKAILTNYNALILYFNKHPDAQNNGFKIFLTTIDKMKLITFFGDLLFVYQRFHKQMQYDFLTLPKFCLHVKNVTKALNDLKSNPLPGGFENALSDQIEIKKCDQIEKFYLKDIELLAPAVSRRETLPLDVLRRNIIDSLTDYLNIRMENQNESLLSEIEAFLKFDENFNINTIHDLIGKDLDKASLHLQYTDLSNSSNEIKGLPLLQLIKYLSDPSRIIFFSELITNISRIGACTHNSADCERVISANNNLKTNKRMCVTTSTENCYLYIHFNMPPLEQWNPRSAVLHYLNEVHRRQSHRSTESKTTTQQPYFKHIFEDSHEKIEQAVEKMQSFKF